MRYADYIRSPAWREVKQRYRASKLPQECYVCGEARVELHHRSYKRLGRERLTDLLPLCRTHHQEAHDYLAARPDRNKSKLNLWTVSKRIKRQYKSSP